MATAKIQKNTEEKTEKAVGARSTSNGMEAKVYNQKGKESGSVKLPENVFGLSWNADLVHQVVTSMQSSAREGNAHTKTRGEVSGGGKKPWKQKGTGRARHGSIRSPIWKGGGTTHGPRNDKNYNRKVNRKMKAKALYTLLSKKFKNSEIIFVDSIVLSEAKTAKAKEVMQSVFKEAFKKRKNALVLALPKKDAMIEKSFGNFNNIEIVEIRNLSPIALATYKYVAIVSPEEALKVISDKI